MSEADHWSQLTDADGQPYDPCRALDAIRSGDAEAGFAELWGRIHHQGDLGTAAYATVPELLEHLQQAAVPDWRAYALVAAVEEQRHKSGNPQIPEWLAERYRSALHNSVDVALEHLLHSEKDELVRSILAVLCHAKGQRTLGSIAMWTEEERQEALGEL